MTEDKPSEFHNNFSMYFHNTPSHLKKKEKADKANHSQLFKKPVNSSLAWAAWNVV